MKTDDNSIAKALTVLDLIDKYGRISVKDAESIGMTRSTVYRYVRALVDAGLLARDEKNGYYTAGPRYVRQQPGTRFDKKSVQARLVEKAKELTNRVDGKRAMTLAAAARVLNVPASTMRQLMKRDAARAG